MGHQWRRVQSPRLHQGENLFLFTQGTGIGTEDATLELEQAIEIEVGGFALRSVREEHDGAPLARDGQRTLEDDGATDGVKDRVRPETGAGLTHRFAETVGSARRVNTKTARHVEPLGDRIANNQLNGRPASAKDERVEQTHAPRTEDHRSWHNAIASSRQSRTLNTTKHASGRLEENGRLVRHAGRHPTRSKTCGTRRDMHVFTESTGLQEVLPKHRTERFAASQAQLTFTARYVVRHDDAIADAE